MRINAQRLVSIMRTPTFLASVSLLVAAVLFRIPPLINAGGVNSDAAVVGLQAMHVLKGEWSWFLWGAGYQSSFETLLAAIGFLFTGPSPLTLMLVPLSGQLVMILLVFRMLVRRIGVRKSIIVTLPLVMMPMPANFWLLFVARQWSVTSIIAAVALLDGASESKRPGLRFAAGAALGVLSLYLDTFAIVFMPGFLLFMVACTCGDGAHLRLSVRRLAWCVGGAAVVGLFVWLARSSVDGTGVVPGVSFGKFSENAKLLWETCLPFALNTKVFEVYGVEWSAPWTVYVIQVLGAALYLGGALWSGVALFLRRLPWAIRRVGAFGLFLSFSSVGAFLVSPDASNQWAARYLAPIVWMAPFALASVAFQLTARRLAFALAPYVVACAISGWMSYGAYVQGPLPVQTIRAEAVAEREVMRVLRARGIKYAIADYWLAYRLTFLFAENPSVVPFKFFYDRYEPYRDGFDAAPTHGAIFHPSVPSERPEPFEQTLTAQGKKFEKLMVEDFTLFIVSKRGWRASAPARHLEPEPAAGAAHPSAAPRRAARSPFPSLD